MPAAILSADNDSISALLITPLLILATTESEKSDVIIVFLIVSIMAESDVRFFIFPTAAVILSVVIV